MRRTDDWRDAPYPGTVKQQGKYLVIDVPLPPDVSTRVAYQPNFYGSLIHETLAWNKLTTKVKARRSTTTSSVGCQNGKRAVDRSRYTSTTNGSDKSVQTVNGSSKC